MNDQAKHKRDAAYCAAEEIKEGMVVGIGTGSTVEYLLEAIAERQKKGLRISCVATSYQTSVRARDLHIPLVELNVDLCPDLTIDGADEVERTSLSLIKGAGGALLREKIVAAASKTVFIIVDETKIVDRLGVQSRLPVEIQRFGASVTLRRLTDMGLRPVLRMDGHDPYKTDGENYVVDCATGMISDPAQLEKSLAMTVGVVESGLFTQLAQKIFVGTQGGVQKLVAATPEPD